MKVDTSIFDVVDLILTITLFYCELCHLYLIFGEMTLKNYLKWQILLPDLIQAPNPKFLNYFVENTQATELTSAVETKDELKKTILHLVDDNLSFEGILREVGC